MWDGKSDTAIVKYKLKGCGDDDKVLYETQSVDDEYPETEFVIDDDVDNFCETITAKVNEDTNEPYFDYDNLDEDQYTFEEAPLPKTLGSQSCHLCLKHMTHFDQQYIWDETIKFEC